MTQQRLPAPIAHGGASANVLDLSANLNPLGTPPHVAAAIARVRYDAYRSLAAGLAVNRLAADCGVERERVVLTAGATEGLRLVVARLLPPGGRLLVVGPTYGEYARLGYFQGGSVMEVRGQGPTFAPAIDELEMAIESVRPDLIMLCDPNNPTGHSLSQADAARILVAARGTPVIVDESFAPFRSPTSNFPQDDRILLVRSLTKVLAIPGVRVGFVVATSALARDLRQLQDPWTVGSHAIAAAAAGGWGLAAGDRSTIADWRRALTVELSRRGFQVLPSTTNFLLVGVSAQTDGLIDGLADQGIAIRRCSSFGLAGVVRIAVPNPVNRTRLLTALDRLHRRAA